MLDIFNGDEILTIILVVHGSDLGFNRLARQSILIRVGLPITVRGLHDLSSDLPFTAGVTAIRIMLVMDAFEIRDIGLHAFSRFVGFRVAASLDSFLGNQHVRGLVLFKNFVDFHKSLKWIDGLLLLLFS